MSLKGKIGIIVGIPVVALILLVTFGWYTLQGTTAI